MRAISVIQGMGGVGKSTFAAALAHDVEISARFPDGVLWVTLGQQPDLLPLLSGWVQALDDYKFKPLHVETTTGQLRTLLHEKEVLLVVDDAWAPVHVTPFLVGGPSSRLLITTREAAIPRTLGVAPFDLDVMTLEQSLALLEGRLGRKLVGEVRGLASGIAATVGYLPLALELTAAQVTDGIPWDELRNDLTLEVARLSSLDLPGADVETDDTLRKRLSLLASFHLSLRRLSDAERRNFAWLGVLPEDVTLAPPMAATLWETDLRSARATLRSLRDRALLLPGVPWPDGTPTYRLHDLLHDLARRLLTAPTIPPQPGDEPGLGLTLSESHAHFLNLYKLQIHGGIWHRAREDGYLHERLTFHLERAGQVDELHSLLQEETEAGRNGWYEARERLGQVAGYLTDLARALGCATRNHEDRPRTIGLQCRYALLTASLNSVAANILPDLLDASVESGVWPVAQALAYARQIPDRLQRARSFSRLIPRLKGSEPEQLVREALEEVQEPRPEVLIALAPHLAPGWLEKALTELLASRDEIWQVDSLAELAPHLPPHLLDAALHATSAMEPGSRAWAIAALAPFLTVPLIVEALELARRIKKDWARAEVLVALAPRLTPPLIDRANETARAIKNKWQRARALVVLEAHSPPAERDKLLHQAKATARTIEPVEQRVDALAWLAGYFPPSEQDRTLREALAAAGSLDDEQVRAAAIEELAPHLTQPVVTEALDCALKVESGWYRDKAMIALAPHLTHSLLERALKSMRTSQFESSKVDFVAAVRPDLMTPELLEEALESARSIPNKADCYEALNALAPVLAPTLIAKALEITRTIGDETPRLRTLLALADHLTPSERHRLLDEALALIKSIDDEARRSQALVSLAPRLTPPLVARAKSLARTIRHQWSRDQALSALSHEQETESTRRSLETLIRVGSGLRQAKALGGLKFRMKTRRLDAALADEDQGQSEVAASEAEPRMTSEERENILREAIAVAPAIEDEAWRTEALLVLAPRLSPALLDQALEVVRDVSDDQVRAAALIKLAPHFVDARAKGRILREALKLAVANRDLEWKAEALTALADVFLPPRRDKILRDALTTVRQIMRERERAEALTALVPRLTPTFLGEALKTAEAIGDDPAREAALAALAPRLAALPLDALLPLWNEAIRIAATRPREGLLRDLLALAPVLVALGGLPAVAETCRAIQDVGRWWP